MKRLWLILLIPMLAGCWDSENIEDLSHVMGVGIHAHQANTKEYLK
ncbi:hypothetical protein SB775_22290 [Peribacillus sp. SIMBA_075]